MDPVVEVPAVQVPNKQRHFLAVFFLSFMWGAFGIDRFYLGKVWTGILKLITFGGLGFWTVIDFILIVSGAMRDKQGNEMLDYDKYKKFANRTILFFALGLGLIILVSGISLILSFSQFVQGGGLEKIINGGDQTNSINQLINSAQNY